MKKPGIFIGFLIFYFTLILTGGVVFVLLGHPVSEAFTISCSAVTLINPGFFFDSGSYGPFGLMILALLIQAGGMSVLIFNGWLFKALFSKGNTTENLNDRKAFFKWAKTGVVIIVIAEIIIFLILSYFLNFKLSHIPIAYFYTISSFFNSGISVISPDFPSFILEYHPILHIGFIFSFTLGGLGLVVVQDLFSPTELRKRMADPLKDWLYITKLAVFGSMGIFVVASALFFVFERPFYLSELPLLDGAIKSLLYTGSARGAGIDIILGAKLQMPSRILLSFIRLFGSVPFSTGGGISLLSILWIWKYFSKKPVMENKVLWTTIKYQAVGITVLFLLSVFFIKTCIFETGWLSSAEISIALITTSGYSGTGLQSSMPWFNAGIMVLMVASRIVFPVSALYVIKKSRQKAYISC